MRLRVSKKSEIPFGAQFSPNQVNLSTLLEIIADNAGDRVKITEAIRDQFFDQHAQNAGDPDKQRYKLADNTVLALRAYELLEEDYATPSTLAQELLLEQEPQSRYQAFAKHILVNLKGTILVETIGIMQGAGDDINLTSLRKTLEQRGVPVPRGSVHLSSMRLWLAQAGIFDPAIKAGPQLYQVNHGRLQEILGIGLDELDRISNLSSSQRAFLRALSNLSEVGPFVANKVADLATGLYAVEYNHKQLPKDILFPLQEAGYIELEKSTEGRGAKPYLVRPTSKLNTEVTEPILRAAAEKAQVLPKELFERSLSDIVEDLDAPDTYIKGKALELLAIYISRLIDLEFQGWRLRSGDTGGAEVDVVVEGTRLIFSRWQIQAKNTSLVRLDEVAKEVGLALTFIYSNVVMLLTTGRFTKDAYAYATHVMKTSNLNVILVDGKELSQISQSPPDIIRILSGKAARAMAVKARADYFSGQ